MPQTVVVSGPGPAQLKELAARIRGAEKSLPANLRRRIRDEAGHGAEAARAAVEAAPAKDTEGGRPHDLRGEIGRTVGASSGRKQISATVSARGRKMPEGKGNLPAYTDSPKGWAHPVFPRGPRFVLRPTRNKRFLRRATTRMVKQGNWPWVRQVAWPGWFTGTLTILQPRIREQVIRAVEETERELQV